MNLTDLISEELKSLLKVKYELKIIPEVEISIPTDKNKADYVTNICFTLSKLLSKKPVSLADEIVQELNKNQKLIPYFEFKSANPGFININTTDQYLNSIVNEIINNKNFGTNNNLSNEKWIIEHTSPNPNKAMHIGHLRNNLIGMAIYKLLLANGAEVVCDAVDNDRGIAIIKAMWGFLWSKNKDGKKITDINYWSLNKNQWYTPHEQNIKSDHFVGQCYLVGAQQFKDNPDHELEMRNMLLGWEKSDQKVWDLWNLILQYAHSGIEITLNRLGSKWDKVWHEHEHYELGKQLVDEGLKKGIFKVSDEGTTITTLKNYNLPDTVVLRSDGTSLYITQDIGLTKLKKDYYGVNKLAWVVGPEQTMAMKQVFAICNQLEIGNISDFHHISYGLVSIIDEHGNKRKMSSRQGDTLTIDDLIDTVKARLIELRPNYTEEDAESISVSAIKFMILKSGRTSDITFDINASLRFEGASGVYLLYTYARFISILEKIELNSSISSFTFTDKERDVLNILSYYPFIVKEAIKDFSSQIIPEFVLQLCQSMNSLYGNEVFIDKDNPIDTIKKGIVTKACLSVLESSFDLMGMKPLKKI